MSRMVVWLKFVKYEAIAHIYLKRKIIPNEDKKKPFNADVQP